MSPGQCAAARNLALPQISQVELADLAGLGEKTVRRFEGGEAYVSDDAVMAMKRALEKRGIIFTKEGRMIGVQRRMAPDERVLD